MFFSIRSLTLLTLGVYGKFRHTKTNLQMKTAGLLKYVRAFCGHQALKGNRRLIAPNFKISIW